MSIVNPLKVDIDEDLTLVEYLVLCAIAKDIADIDGYSLCLCGKKFYPVFEFVIRENLPSLFKPAEIGDDLYEQEVIDFSDIEESLLNKGFLLYRFDDSPRWHFAHYALTKSASKLLGLEHEPFVRDADATGFVYVAKNNRNGYFKIGWSKNPSVRETTLQSEEPDIEFIIKKPGSRRDEKALHDLFKEWRVRGEWFNLRKHDQQIFDEYFI